MSDATQRFTQRFCILLMLSGMVWIMLGGCGQPADEGTTVFGQKPPGLEPVAFLPDVISITTRPHSALSFSPDGRELYWSGYVIGEGRAEWIFHSQFNDGSWSAPEKATFNGGRGNGPAMSADGNRIYFGAQRPWPGRETPLCWGIWYVDLTAAGWSEPQPIEVTLDSAGFAGRPSLTASGNLYFIGMKSGAEFPMIYRCEFSNDMYSAPAPVPGPVNNAMTMDPFVDPKERFILLMCDPDRGNENYGSSDVFISYLQSDGAFMEPINLGTAINTTDFDRSPSLSRDGKYLFFIRAEGEMFVESDAHYYWVDGGVLDSLMR